MGGGDTFTLKAGRKKWNEAHLSNNPANPWGLHSRGAFGYVASGGEAISKAGEQVKRPLYETGAGSEPALCHQQNLAEGVEPEARTHQEEK